MLGTKDIIVNKTDKICALRKHPQICGSGRVGKHSHRY